MLHFKNQLLPSNSNIVQWRVENSGRFSSSTVMGNWPPHPTPSQLWLAAIVAKLAMCIFTSGCSITTESNMAEKAIRECKRIRCDRLFPLVKKGRGACCIVVLLIKNRRGAAFSPVLTCRCMSLFRGLQRWRCEQTLARITKFTDILKIWVLGLNPWGGVQGLPWLSPEGSFSSAMTLRRDKVVEEGWIDCS